MRERLRTSGRTSYRGSGSPRCRAFSLVSPKRACAPYRARRARQPASETWLCRPGAAARHAVARNANAELYFGTRGGRPKGRNASGLSRVVEDIVARHRGTPPWHSDLATKLGFRVRMHRDHRQEIRISVTPASSVHSPRRLLRLRPRKCKAQNISRKYPSLGIECISRTALRSTLFSPVCL